MRILDSVLLVVRVLVGNDSLPGVILSLGFSRLARLRVSLNAFGVWALSPKPCILDAPLKPQTLLGL